MKMTKEVLVKITQEFNAKLGHWVTVRHYVCW